MKCFLSVLGIAVLFSSCAKLVHERYYPLAVSADQPETQIIYNEKKYSTPIEITVCRSDEPLQLTVVHDSIQKELLIPSRLSYMYWFGNLYWAAPIGWLVELDSPKSRTYGREVIIHPLDSVSYTVKYPFLKSIKAKPTNKGDLNILFSLPEINPFYLYSLNNSIKESVGFPGIGAGFEYYYAHNKALQLRADAILTSGFNFEPFDFTPIGWEDQENWVGQETSDYSYTYNFSLTDNWKTGRFVMGYGINYAVNRWREHIDHWYNNQWEEEKGLPKKYYPQIGNQEEKRLTNHSFGFVFNTYYRFTNHFYVGVIYRPSVYCFSPSPQFRYEHIISVDLAWKISLKK